MPWFDDLGTKGIFSVVGMCFKFFLLHLNPFLKIPNPNHDLNRSKNCCGFVFSQSEQKLLNHDLNRSKNCYEFMVRVLWVGSLVFGEVLEGTRVLETRVPCGFS